MNKGNWRAWAIGRRDGLHIDHTRIVVGLYRFMFDIRGFVLTYRPMSGEVDLDPLLIGFPCAVTRTWPEGRLTIHAAVVPMERHRYGFVQPVAAAPELDAREIAVALVPGLAFDRHGTRLGHGAGHYDRLLPRLAGIPLVGVTPAALVVDRLPRESHDVAMTHLATEAGVHAVS